MAEFITNRVEYILVKCDGDNEMVGSELCKDFEQFDGVIAAAIVRKGSRHAQEFEYTGEFYSTPQANERLAK